MTVAPETSVSATIRAFTSSGRGWGDEDFQDEEGFLPPKEVTGPDARGIKTEIEYAFVDGKK